MAAEAALGAVFGELLKAVLAMKDKAIMFKQTLASLRSTLVAIAPVIKEMEQHNNDLSRPKEELESLIRGMEEGTKLVSKCSKIHRLNLLARVHYQEQLVALVDSLVRFFIIDMQAQTARDQKETLLKVTRILSKVNKLPLVSTEDTTGSSSDFGPVPVDVTESEIHDSTEMQTAESVAGTNSADQVRENVTQQVGQLKDTAVKLHMGAARSVKSPFLASLGFKPGSNEVSNASIDGLNIQATSSEPDLTGSNNQLLSNGSSHISNRGVGHNKQSLSSVTSINGSKTKDSESRFEYESIKLDEAGVYVILISLPGGVRGIIKLFFSHERFTQKQAEQWWAENRDRVHLQYNLKDWAERLPIGAARNVKSPSLASFGSNPGSNEVSNGSIDGLNIQATSPEPDFTGSNNQLLSNGSNHISNCGVGHNKHSLSDATSINGSKTKDSESHIGYEWTEQDESGVYLTLFSLPGGVIFIKKVRFSRRWFKEEQAEQWWIENKARVFEQYNIRMIDI